MTTLVWGVLMLLALVVLGVIAIELFFWLIYFAGFDPLPDHDFLIRGHDDLYT